MCVVWRAFSSHFSHLLFRALKSFVLASRCQSSKRNQRSKLTIETKMRNYLRVFPTFRHYFWVLISVRFVTGRPLRAHESKFSEDYFYEYNFPFDDESEMDPEVSPGLYEGDIAGPPELLIRLGLDWEIFPERKWNNATVPYIISSKYLPDERIVIEYAISTLSFFTCINFTPWNGDYEDYLSIAPVDNPKGCWSFVGKIGGKQHVSLEPPDSKSLKCFGTLGKPIHELLHALGLFHEQARADRDKHVTILTKNIDPGRLHNFKKQSEANTTYFFPYDYDSVMHYGSYFFSKSRYHPTIVPKKQGARIGQRIMLSKGDCLKLNAFYGCLDKEPFISEKYKAFCDYLAY